MVFISFILSISSEKYLEECLNSIFSQTFEDYEVICINNTSSKDVTNILNDYIIDSRLKIIQQLDDNESSALLKNRAINESSGKYLNFLNSNTVLYNENTLEKLVKIIEKHDVNMFSSNIKVIEDSPSNDPFYDLNFVKKYGKEDERDPNFYGVPIFLSKNVFKREFILENKITFSDFDYGQDMIFLTDILTEMECFIRIPQYFCEEHLVRAEMTCESVINYIKCYEELLRKFSLKKEFKKVVEPLSTNVPQLIEAKSLDFTYKEYKMLELEIKKTIELCSNRYNFSYKVRRTLRYLMNNIHNKVTSFDVAVSIIIPSYNVEDYLDDCLISLINQSFENFEVLIVDDSSTDSTVELIKYYENLDPRIKFIKKDKKSGSGGSRNYAMKYARGKYIQFLDADDWLDLNTLEKLYGYAEKYETDIVIFKLINYDTDEKTFYKNRYYSIPSLKKFENKVFNLDDLTDELFKIAVSPVNKLYSRYYLESINAEFPENYIHQDNPFFYNTFCDAEKVYVTDEYFYNRRRTNSSISTRLDDTQLGTIEIVEFMLNVFIKNNLYQEYKRPLLNRLLFKLRNRSKQVGEEFKEEYYNRTKEKLFKFMFSYGLDDDLKETLYGDNKRYFQKVIYSKNYKNFLKQCNKSPSNP